MGTIFCNAKRLTTDGTDPRIPEYPSITQGDGRCERLGAYRNAKRPKILRHLPLPHILHAL